MNEIAHPSDAAPPAPANDVAGQTFNPFHPSRAIIFSLLALILVVLSFWGGLDDLALSKVDELIDRTLLLLAGMIAIDVVISVLQSIEISAIAGIEIGQALEPLDDGIERLTNGLLLATGSLFLQDILLGIVSGSVGKWGFLVIAAMMVASLLLAQSERVRIACVTIFGLSHVTLAQIQGFFIKAFIVATVVRFIVPIFMGASLLVSQALVAPDIMENVQELERQEETLSELEGQISQARDEAVEEQTSQVEDLEVLGERKVQLEEMRASLESERDRLDDRIREVQLTVWNARARQRKDQVLQKLGLGDDAAEALEKANDQVRQMRDQALQKLGLGDDAAEALDNANARQRQMTDQVLQKLGFGDDPAEALAEAIARVRQTESDIEHKQSRAACLGRPAAGESCGPVLAEARRQALGEIKIRLESEQQDLRKRLRSLQEARERYIAELGGEAEGEAGSGWRDRLWNWGDKAADALPSIGGDDSAEGGEAAKPTIEDIDRELAEASTLVKQGESELACVDRRMTGEHCDSPAIDGHVQSALGDLKETLESDLGRLRADLASYQGEQMQLAELKEFKTKRARIEGDIEENNKHIEQNESELECAEQLVAGEEDCDTFFGSLKEKMSSAVGMFSRIPRLALGGLVAVKDMAKDMVKRLALLLILVLIENVLLPIIFLAIMLKASVPITRGLTRISASMNEDARAALSNMDRALPHRKGGDSDKPATT